MRVVRDTCPGPAIPRTSRPLRGPGKGQARPLAVMAAAARWLRASVAAMAVAMAVAMAMAVAVAVAVAAAVAMTVAVAVAAAVAAAVAKLLPCSSWCS